MGDLLPQASTANPPRALRAPFGTRLPRATASALFALLVLFGVAGGCGGQQSLDPMAAACQRYVATLLGVGCPGAQYPADEVSRLDANFAAVCRNAFTLPGSTLTVAQLDACAASLREDNCWLLPFYYPTDACVFQGTLPAGAACSASPQCQSGFCGFSLTSGGSPGIGGASSDCGRCVAPAELGQPCPYGLCVPNAYCETPSDPTSTAPATCVAINTTVVGLGGNCGSGVCDDNLICSAEGVCVEAIGQGGPCQRESSDCQLGLYCGSQGTCGPPGGEGSACGAISGLDCATGLSCQGPGGGPAYGNGLCAPQPPWDGPGMSCEAGNCLHGACNNFPGPSPPAPPPLCPTLLADGQPCTGDPSTTCDTLSDCVNGFCQIIGNLACQWEPSL
jgi:hypothetical protein